MRRTIASVTLASPGETPIVVDDSVWVAITHELDHLDPATGMIDRRVTVPQVGAGGPSTIIGQTLYVSDNVASVHGIPIDLLTHAAP